MAFDDGDGILKIDFAQSILEFSCPSCGKINILNIGKIESLLKQRTKLPSIGGAAC